MKVKTVSSGIYRINNLDSGKIYIGSSVNMRQRKSHHHSSLKLGKHENQFLQSDWDEYGENNFAFEMIEFVYDLDKLLEREQFWIDFYQSYERNIGYNKKQFATKIDYENMTENHKILYSKSIDLLMVSQLNNRPDWEMEGYISSHSRMTREDIRIIRTRLIAGETIIKLAREYGVSDMNINNIKLGKAYPDIYPELIMKKVGRKPSLKNEEVIKIKKLLLSGMKIEEIASLFEIDESVVVRIKNKHSYRNIKVDGFDDSPETDAPLTKEEVVEIKRLFSEGMGCADISRHLNKRYGTVLKIKHNINHKKVDTNEEVS